MFGSLKSLKKSLEHNMLILMQSTELGKETVRYVRTLFTQRNWTCGDEIQLLYADQTF